MERIRAIALANRSLIFAKLLSALPYDDEQYIGRILTRHAISAGYCEDRKALKGNTLVQWSQLAPPVGDGSGTPTRWACLAALDLLFEHAGAPDVHDTVFLRCWIFYRHLSLGNIEAVIAEFPQENRSTVCSLIGE